MRKFHIILPLALLIFAGPRISLAQEISGEEIEEVVVTATRLETPVKEVASSITVITSDEIERKHAKTVLEVLREVPGINVTRQGGVGGSSSVFMRGANSFHTLVLIDGIEVNDPINPNRAFDFAHMTTDNIERIEILRGPQSTLYGSDAIGGVINIITKQGRGKARTVLSLETGAFDTYNVSAGVSGGAKRVDYSFYISDYKTEGISSAAEADGNTEKDGYENMTFSGRVGYKLGDSLNFGLAARAINARKELDDFGGAGGDDPNFVESIEQLFVRVQAAATMLDGRWENTLGISYTRSERDDNDGPDPLHTVDINDSFFIGTLVKLDWQSNYYISETNTLIFGIETERERGKSEINIDDPIFGPFNSTFDEEETITGFYVEQQLQAGDVFYSTFGVRTDDHSRFGSETTWRVAPAFLFDDAGWKIKASYGTGFKAPSLSQLLGFGGSVNLKPEKSGSWDLGVENKIAGDRVSLGVTYFVNNIEDLIVFNPSFVLENINEAEIKGLEFVAAVQVSDGINVDGQYTHQDTVDRSTDNDLLRRADDQFALDVTLDFSGGSNLNFEVIHIGSRDDMDFSTFPATRVELGAYTLVNASATLGLGEKITLTGRIENLLDENYEEVLGYGTAGISGYVGVKAEL